MDTKKKLEIASWTFCGLALTSCGLTAANIATEFLPEAIIPGLVSAIVCGKTSIYIALYSAIYHK